MEKFTGSGEPGVLSASVVRYLPPLSGVRSSSWILGVCLAIQLGLAVVCVYRVWFHPLAKFPGPLAAKVSGQWRNTRYWRGSWHDDVLAAHAAYGPVVRVAPNELSVVDEQATKALYGHGTSAMKTEWYTTWADPFAAPGLFPTRDRALHGFLRKRVASAYSMSTVLKCEGYVQGCLDLLFVRLCRRTARGEAVEMSEWTQAFAFDVIGELAFSGPLGHLETETDVNGLRSVIHTIFKIVASLGHIWGQARWLNNRFMLKLQAVLNLPDPFRDFRNWVLNRVAARREASDEAQIAREDMLSHFIKMKQATGEPAGDDEVLVEGLMLVGAGADTTAAAMSACVLHLCQHPQVYKDVQAEVDAYYQSHDLQRPITYNETQELPLLVAAIRESMRIMPSIPWQMLRYAPEDMTVAGRKIPPGTSIGSSPIAVNHNPLIFGDDADKFRPARWLEDPQKTRYMNANVLTFGGQGPRMCVGRNIALVEIHKFVAQFLHHFDAELVNPAQPWKIRSWWFIYVNDLYIKLTVREKS